MLSSTGIAASSVTFEGQVRPILKTHCFQCHGENGETKGDLDVRLARFILKGGKDGAVIKPGDAGHSLMLEKLRKGEMPKGKSKLSDKEIATIEQWIAQGAKTARSEPEKLGPEHAFTDEERAWWAFQPIKATRVEPRSGGRNTIDSFIQKKLAENDLSFSPATDPTTFIRRATLDLTGVPPTPDEVDNFVAASIRNPQSAVRNLIDSLLAKPSYGERWGRHWLDVAGYSDSDGYTEKDTERAWERN